MSPPRINPGPVGGARRFAAAGKPAAATEPQLRARTGKPTRTLGSETAPTRGKPLAGHSVPSPRPHDVITEATSPSGPDLLQPRTEVRAHPAGQVAESSGALQGFEHRGVRSHPKAGTRLLELGCLSELQRRGIGSVWTFTNPPSTLPDRPRRAGQTAHGVFPTPPCPSPERTQHDRLSETYPLPWSLLLGAARVRRPVRRPFAPQGSPRELFGPFSTSSQGDKPARGSTPAGFRLRRWSDLDGLLPP